jgi:glycosyltransferase involved in cell wall biosynthesis
MSSPSVIINAVSAKAGGGLNDLVETIPRLTRKLQERGIGATSYVSQIGAAALRSSGVNMDGIQVADPKTPLGRAVWEYVSIPQKVRADHASAVFHFANFIVRDLAVPQMTVLRSLTYFSNEYAGAARRGVQQRLRYLAGKHYSRRTIENAEAIFCISQTHRSQIIQSVGSSAEKVRVAHLGVEVPQSARQLTKASADLPDKVKDAISGKRVVLNVAHYYSHKNLGTLLQAIQRLHKDDPSIVLVLTAGIEAYRGAQTEATRMEAALANELSQRGALVDLGAVDKQMVWRLLGSADVFAFPSELESFGHPLLEAMGMRVPVVASDTPIHRETCADAAEFHATHDSNALAMALRNVLDDPGARQRLIESGLQNIGRFSWDAHVQLLADAITKICGK